MSLIKNILSKTSKSQKKYYKISTDLAAQIAAYLKEKNWTQAEFAKQLNKKESEVSKWLSGRHNFTVKTLALIESVLDKDLFIIPLDVKKEKQAGGYLVESINKELTNYSFYVLQVGETARVLTAKNKTIDFILGHTTLGCISVDNQLQGSSKSILEGNYSFSNQ